MLSTSGVFTGGLPRRWRQSFNADCPGVGGADRSPPPLVPELEPEQGLEPKQGLEQGPAQEAMEDEGDGDEGRRGRKTATRTTSPPLERSGGGGGSGGRESLNPTSSQRAAAAAREQLCDA